MFSQLLRPQLEELRQEMGTKGTDPEAMAEGQRRMQLLFKQHGVTPFTPLKGLIIQGPIFISFFFAIRNMAEKVPSFKTGGTLWFTDLTTADTTYILPLLTAITFIIMVESNMQEGMEGNPVAGTMKKFSRIIAFLSIPILMGIEKALFCYWLTSNLFTLGRPDVRKLLNLPDAVTSSSTGQPKPPSPLPFSFEQPKDQSVVGHEDPPMSSSEDPSVSSPESSSSVPERRISRSSVLNQRIRTLERQLKDQKKKKLLATLSSLKLCLIIRFTCALLTVELTTTGTDPEAMAEGQRRMQLLFKQHGVTPFTPLKGLIIQGPIFISFFFAIRNMAEKVPSFKTGGTLWFTDLTSADTTYILPLLTAITFIIMVESNMQEGMEGNPVAGTMKKFSRIIAFLSIPILMGIEKALFCYWLTSNLFTLGRPDVRKLLNLPDAVTSSSTGQPKPPSPIPFSFEQPKDQSVVGHEDPPMSSSEDPSMSSSESSSSVPERKISRSSVLNQRIRTLERQLKDQKKKK
ncbi:hypothetical protein F2Q69_00002337 [Brassica cretica]|uniref:Membrane insertase YidC/Oxa/ALB C-terminal domain-containing protein n=1 Tax=Brassica cretica TaxID=69181 RepID=A0A8S9P747_BRACR|nr:hypothetical protein F2Q69_00002337 [Brassica cretica]